MVYKLNSFQVCQLSLWIFGSEFRIQSNKSLWACVLMRLCVRLSMGNLCSSLEIEAQIWILVGIRG